MADPQIATKIYSTLGLGKQVSSSSHLSVLNSKVDFAPSSNSGGGALLSGSFVQSKYTQLGSGNYVNRINNNNSLKEASVNGHLRQDDRHKCFRVHQGQREDNNHNIVTEGCPPEPRKRLSDPQVVRLDWIQPAPRIGAGLANLGNTCFMNTVIQCLTYCPPLAVYLLQDPERHSPTCKITSFCMMCELQKHIKRALDKHGQSIRPTYMYQKLKSIAKHFQQGRQEDAHEFLRYVIDNLWKSALSTQEGHANLDPATKETTVINHIFGGYSRSQVVCLRCNGCSNTYDHFMDIILDIKGVSSLEGALAKFVEPEMLDNDNAYKCPKCNIKVKAEKKFTVYKAPNVATFQFKRFDYHRFNGGKITKHILYPERLNLKSYMAEKTAESVWYRLNSVLVHSGHTCNSGHYYCYVRAPSNQWYRMDDTMVQPVGINQVLHQQAYVLFYVRVSSQRMVPVKKPIIPFCHSSLNAEKNSHSGNMVNMNRPLNASPRPGYFNSHSCSASRPLTNGTLVGAIPTTVPNKFGMQQAVATPSKLSVRERISFSMNKNSHSPLVRVKGKPPEGGNASLAQVHSPKQVANNKTLVPYAGDSSASTSDSCSESERKLPKLINNISQNTLQITTPECNGNSSKESSKPDPSLGKRTSLLEFERPPETLGNRSKATVNWNVSDANLESPSIASNSSNNSMNSTTTDWNVTEQEAATPRHGSRYYNGWAVTPTSATAKGETSTSNSECVTAKSVPPSNDFASRSSSKAKGEDETDKEERRLLLPFRATPQGGGGESTLYTEGLQQSSQHSVPFVADGDRQPGQPPAEASTTIGPVGVSAAPVAVAACPDGKRKRPEPSSSHEEGHRTVPKRHKNGGDTKLPSPVWRTAEGKRQRLSMNRRPNREEGHKWQQHQLIRRDGSGGSSSSSEVWEERTKDTIEKERQQRLETGSSRRNGKDNQQFWNEDRTWKRNNCHHPVLENLISNGGRGYGSRVTTWEGCESRLNSGENDRKKHFSDHYNEDLDRGKERKDRRRHSSPSNSFSHRNPFQGTYERNHNRSLNNSWQPFSSNQHYEKQRGSLHYQNHGGKYHRSYHHKHHQEHSYNNNYYNKNSGFVGSQHWR